MTGRLFSDVTPTTTVAMEGVVPGTLTHNMRGGTGLDKPGGVVQGKGCHPAGCAAVPAPAPDRGAPEIQPSQRTSYPDTTGRSASPTVVTFSRAAALR